MLNLITALQDDIAAGLAGAQRAGDLPKIDEVPVVVTHAGSSEHGDYASPVALALTKQMKKPPLDIVAAIVEHMPKKEYAGKLEAAAPGFLNVRLNPGWLTARLDDVLEEDLCADVTIGQGKKVNLEFISANPTGPLTLGNVRTAFSVDTLSNVLACAGYGVTREYYINDAGAQIERLGESVIRRILQAQGEPVDFPDELYRGDYIRELGAQIAERLRENDGKELTKVDLTDEGVRRAVSSQALAQLLAAIKQTIRQDLKIEFDVWTSEAALRQGRLITDTLDKLQQNKHTYRKDGALYLRTTAFGDSEDRVLVKKDGEYAYIMPDIAYHQDKYNRGYDLIFTFVGADHQGHAPKLMAAMQALGNDVSRLKIVAAQWLRFISNGQPVKLSKRAGNIVTPKELIDEVGYDAARFFMLQHALTTHMDFDLDLARERSERNPVYYVQYAYVRLQSIVRRAKEEGHIMSLGEMVALNSHGALTHTAEIALMRQLYRLPEVIADCATTFAVQPLAYYAHEVATAVHFFYNNVPVLQADNRELITSRLQLVLAARKVLGHTLELLGVSQPDVM